MLGIILDIEAKDNNIRCTWEVNPLPMHLTEYILHPFIW